MRGPCPDIMKFQDWADAYKHVHVREVDIPLQVVEWGGMYFVDR